MQGTKVLSLFTVSELDKTETRTEMNKLENERFKGSDLDYTDIKILKMGWYKGFMLAKTDKKNCNLGPKVLSC